MSKGKFEAGKRVILLSAINPELKYLIGTVQTLSQKSYVFANSWLMNPKITDKHGRLASWKEKGMMVIDPDETPEESLDAMRLLTQIPKEEKV